MVQARDKVTRPTTGRTNIMGASINVGTKNFVEESSLIAKSFSLCLLLLIPSGCGEK
jgi:hypothetical protein